MIEIYWAKIAAVVVIVVLAWTAGYLTAKAQGRK